MGDGELSSSPAFPSLPSLAEYLTGYECGVVVDGIESMDIMEVVARSCEAPQQIPSICFDLLRANSYETFLRYCKYIMFGGNPLKKVKELVEKGTLFSRQCSQVWSVSELAYRCNTCGVTGASSLCIGCFQNGDHEGHDFNIYKSGYGGCCDCGNEESWDPKGNCVHHPGKGEENPLDSIRNHPILGEYGPMHIIIHIIMLLTYRSIVIVQNRGLVEEGEGSNALDGLLVSKDDPFCMKSIPWLDSISSIADPIRGVIAGELLAVCLQGEAKCFFSVPTTKHDTVLDLINNVRASSNDLLRYNQYDLLWELSASYPFADVLVDLYLQLLYDETFKAQFMELFIIYYPSIASAMEKMKTDAEKRAMDDYANRISAQLWSVSGYVLSKSSRTSNVLGVTMDTLLWILVKSIPEESEEGVGAITIDCTHETIVSEHYWVFATDIMTLFSHPSLLHYVLKERNDLFQKWLFILAITANMDKMKKESTHVEYENNVWKSAASIELTFARSFNPICSAFQDCIKEFSNSSNSVEQKLFIQRIILSVLERIMDVLQVFDVADSLRPHILPRAKNSLVSEFSLASGEVSLHCPLHRLLAGLIEVAAPFCSLEEMIAVEKFSVDSNVLESLIEFPLRIQALCGQEEAGLWIRNGNALRSQVFLYRRKGSFTDWGFNNDILLLQSLSILLKPDAFLTIAIKRFDLSHLLLMPSLRTLREVFGSKDRIQCVIFQFISFLLHLVTYRCKVGMTEKDILRYEIIHGLIPQDLPFSQLQSTMCSRLARSDDFKTVVEEVADYVSASVFKEGCYQLKPEFWSYYDPYFPRHYGRQVQQCQDRFLAHIQRTAPSTGILPPLHLYNTIPSFSRIMELLWCPSMLYICYTILFLRHSESFEDSSLHGVLQLLTLASTHAPRNNLPLSSACESTESFPSDSFDENLRNAHRLPGGSLLSQLCQLHDSSGTEKTTSIRPNMEYLMKLIGDRCSANAHFISSRLSIFKDKEEEVMGVGDLGTEDDVKKRQDAILSQFQSAQQSFLDFMDDEDYEDDEEELHQDCEISCALCRDSVSLQQSITENRPIGCVALCQPSNLLRSQRKNEARIEEVNLSKVDINEAEAANRENAPEPETKESTLPFSNTPLYSHIYKELLKDIESETVADIRFCRHYVHMDCMHRYFTSISRRRDYNYKLVNLYNGEFLCPSCRRLCNCVVPMIPTTKHVKDMREAPKEEITQSLDKIIGLQDLPEVKLLLEGQEHKITPEGLSHCVVEPFPFLVTPTTRYSPVAEPESEESNLFINLDAFLKRVSLTPQGTWMSKEMCGEYSFQLYNLFLLLQERLASLELQSRSITYPFIDFISTQEQEMQENENLLQITFYYRKEETSSSYREYIAGLLLEHIMANGGGILRAQQMDFLSCDPFSLFLTIICCNAIPLSHRLLYELIRPLYVLALCQAFYSLFPVIGENVSAFVQRIRGVGPDEVEVRLQSLVMKFLKKCTLFTFLLDKRCATAIPFVLTADRDSSRFEKDYAQMCCILHLPTKALAFLQSDFAVHLLRSWFYITPPSTIISIPSIGLKKEVVSFLAPSGAKGGEREVSCRLIYVSKPFAFVTLPDLYQDIYQYVMRQNCDRCERLTPEAGICLTCGQIICGGSKHIEMAERFSAFGAVNVFATHAKNCSSVLLNLRLCTILLFRSQRISVWNSIYLDNHGEEDIELRRGKALFLAPSRLEQIRRFTVSQTVDHDTRVLEKTQLLQ